MTRPLIGITAGEIYNREHPWAPVTQGQAYTYVVSVHAAGGTPVILPIIDDPVLIDDLYPRLDGILFSGGNDLDPRLYNEVPNEKLEDTSVLRDNYETILLKRALADKKPVFAICRGMQLLNVVRGGTLYQDIPSVFPNAEDHRKSTKQQDMENLAHILRIKPECKLAHILQATEIPTNTHHHQAVKDAGEGLEVVAWAEDDIIEGIELPGDAFVIGIQSHPESLSGVEPRWLRLFEAFVEAAKA
jgi:putative glutamine amidotransferase